MKIASLAALFFLTGLFGAGDAAAQHNHGGGHGGGHAAQPQYDCPLSLKDYSPALKNLEDGVEILLTARYAKDIAALRATAEQYFSSKSGMDKNCPARVPGAKTEVEEADGGVIITITAKSPAAVKTIQAAAAYACKRDRPAGMREFKSYTCPMGHFLSSQPGKCPSCGMELKEKI